MNSAIGSPNCGPFESAHDSYDPKETWAHKDVMDALLCASNDGPESQPHEDKSDRGKNAKPTYK